MRWNDYTLGILAHLAQGTRHFGSEERRWAVICELMESHYGIEATADELKSLARGEQ